MHDARIISCFLYCNRAHREKVCVHKEYFQVVNCEMSSKVSWVPLLMAASRSEAHDKHFPASLPAVLYLNYYCFLFFFSCHCELFSGCFIPAVLVVCISRRCCLILKEIIFHHASRSDRGTISDKWVEVEWGESGEKENLWKLKWNHSELPKKKSLNRIKNSFLD